MSGSSDALALHVPNGPPFRVLDMPRLLAEPLPPIPWVADHLAAEGMVTTVAGPAGLGKSWLALLLAAGVHHGRLVGGIQCSQGHAVYFDAENGWRMVTRRFHDAGLENDAVTVADADGLDLARADHLAAVADYIEDEAATFVVFDSLKRLTPNRARARTTTWHP